MERATVQ